MSIVIEGVEMPSMGYREIRIHPNGTVTERLDRCEVTVGKAVSVPKHGKLFDADAILQEATKGEEPFDWIDKNELLRLFFDAPTLIPASEEDQGKNI